MCILALLGLGARMSNGEEEPARYDKRVAAAERLEGKARRFLEQKNFEAAEAAALEAIDVKRVAYKWRWIDREGMRAADEEPWKPLMLYENSNQIVTAVAPSNKAVDFRLILLSQE